MLWSSSTPGSYWVAKKRFRVSQPSTKLLIHRSHISTIQGSVNLSHTWIMRGTELTAGIPQLQWNCRHHTGRWGECCILTVVSHALLWSLVIHIWWCCYRFYWSWEMYEHGDWTQSWAPLWKALLGSLQGKRQGKNVRCWWKSKWIVLREHIDLSKQ